MALGFGSFRAVGFRCIFRFAGFRVGVHSRGFKHKHL